MSHKASKALLPHTGWCSRVGIESKMDIRTACVLVSSAAKRFKQMHEKIGIFYTVLVQNIENGKLHRQVDSVDTGLNRESKSSVFFSVRSLYCIYQSFQGKIIHARMIEFLLYPFIILNSDIDFVIKL